jgi:cytochrome b561
MILLHWNKAAMICIVTATTALAKQIKRYREMTGEQRLKIALGLHELSCNVAREGIRHQNPTADEVEVERLLHRRIELANSEKQASEIVIARMLTRTPE